MRRAYQQGIQIPETLGIPLTKWKAPEQISAPQASFSPANSGASRNYGTTPAYVDTIPARWTAGEIIPANLFGTFQKPTPKLRQKISTGVRHKIATHKATAHGGASVTDDITDGDPFMVALSGASDEPMPSPVEWKDSPDMPRLGLPGEAGDKALEDWLRSGGIGRGSDIGPTASPPSSRTKRRPKT